MAEELGGFAAGSGPQGRRSRWDRRGEGYAWDAHVVPGLVKIDGYSATAKMVTETFDIVPGSTLGCATGQLHRVSL